MLLYRKIKNIEKMTKKANIVMGFILGIIFMTFLAIKEKPGMHDKETFTTSSSDKEEKQIVKAIENLLDAKIIPTNNLVAPTAPKPDHVSKRKIITTFEHIPLLKTTSIENLQTEETLQVLPVVTTTSTPTPLLLVDTSVLMTEEKELSVEAITPASSLDTLVTEEKNIATNIVLQDTFATVATLEETPVTQTQKEETLDPIELAYGLIVTSESIKDTSETSKEIVTGKETFQSVSLGEDYIASSDEVLFTVQKTKTSARLGYVVIEKTKEGVQHVDTIEHKPLYSVYYKNVLPFNDMGTAFAQKNDTTWCIVGIDGIEFMPTNFKKIEESYYGIVAAQLPNGKWQYVNPFGQIIHKKEIMFDKVTPFSYLDKKSEPCAKGIIVGDLKTTKKKKELEILYKIYPDGRVEIADPAEPIIGYTVKK